MAQEQQYALAYRLDEGEWQQLALHDSELMLGRLPEYGLFPNRPTVSPCYTRLGFTAEGFWLTDLGATGGTQIDGKPLPPRARVAIRPGQRFSVGNYTLLLQPVVAEPQPQEPPSSTLTPLPTPTALSGQPAPALPAQGVAGYQASVMEQHEEYMHASQAQGDECPATRTAQGDEYAIRREEQGNQYSAAMRAYGDVRAAWQESREKAINSGEGLLAVIVDNYGRSFQDTVAGRCAAMLGILVGLVLIVLVVQRRKDAVWLAGAIGSMRSDRSSVTAATLRTDGA